MTRCRRALRSSRTKHVMAWHGTEWIHTYGASRPRPRSRIRPGPGLFSSYVFLAYFLNSYSWVVLEIWSSLIGHSDMPGKGETKKRERRQIMNAMRLFESKTFSVPGSRFLMLLWVWLSGILMTICLTRHGEYRCWSMTLKFNWCRIDSCWREDDHQEHIHSMDLTPLLSNCDMAAKLHIVNVTSIIRGTIVNNRMIDHNGRVLR